MLKGVQKKICTPLLYPFEEERVNGQIIFPKTQDS